MTFSHLFCRTGEPFLAGEPLRADLTGELSFFSLPAMVFYTATFSLKRFRGSLRSNFSISTGVYWSRNSSIER